MAKKIKSTVDKTKRSRKTIISNAIGISKTAIIIKEIEKKQIQFSPTPELLIFANEFSESYKVLTADKEGVSYVSNDKQYHIKYFDHIFKINDYRAINSPSRTGHNTKIIEISKNKLIELKSKNDFVFFLILWGVQILVNLPKGDMKTDKQVLNYYLTTGRSIKNVATGFIKMCSNTDTELNKKRVIQFMKITKAFQNKNKN